MPDTTQLLRKALEPCTHCQYRQECKSEGACRRESALAQAGGTREFTPRHGDKLRGIWASEKNPQRDGYYVETTRHKTSRFGSARYYRCTDGKGQFWEYPPESVVLLERADIRAALSSPAESFCDANCTWRDHQPGCVRAAEAVQPVKRYDMGYFQGAPAMFEQPNGKYVRYEDSVQPIWFDEMREINGMTEAQIDAELIAHGISPADAVQRAQAAINDAVTQAARHGTVQCPLCGKTYAHEHSPEEVQIFRNGVKRGAAPLPQGDGADAKDAARYRCLRKGNDYEHDAPMALLYEKESDTGERPFWSLAGEALDDAVDAAMRASSASEGAQK